MPAQCEQLTPEHRLNPNLRPNLSLWMGSVPSLGRGGKRLNRVQAVYPVHRAARMPGSWRISYGSCINFVHSIIVAIDISHAARSYFAHMTANFAWSPGRCRFINPALRTRSACVVGCCLRNGQCVLVDRIAACSGTPVAPVSGTSSSDLSEKSFKGCQDEAFSADVYPPSTPLTSFSSTASIPLALARSLRFLSQVTSTTLVAPGSAPG